MLYPKNPKVEEHLHLLYAARHAQESYKPTMKTLKKGE